MSAMACAIFNELRLEGKLCDVTISVDGVEFNAHKNILCSCSHYFRSVLETRGDGDKQHFPGCVTLPQSISSASMGTKTLLRPFPQSRSLPGHRDSSTTWYQTAALEAAPVEASDAVQGWTVAAGPVCHGAGGFPSPHTTTRWCSC